MKDYGKTQKRKWSVIKSLAFIAYIVVSIGTIQFFDIDWIGAALLLFSSILIYLYIGAEDREVNFKKGIFGEELIEKELKNIGFIHHFRDLTIEDGKWNIDFVVVASTGVFVLEVKSYEGRILAYGDAWHKVTNGKRKPLASFSKQAKSNAFKLRQYLSSKINKNLPYFTPVVVLTNPYNREDIVVNSSNYLVCGIEELTATMDRDYKLNPQLREELIRKLNVLEGEGF